MTLSLYSQTPSNRRLLSLAFAVYIALVAFSAWNHELYYSEADPWIVASDIGWNEFVDYFRYALHPPLWYVLLMPFARAGLPVDTITVINTLIACASAYLILFRSPFSLWIRIPLVFSMFLSYQYAVITRGYMLMILILCAVTLCYRARLDKPLRYAILLALLFNTETFALIPAIALAFFFTFDCLRQPQWFKRYAPALAIIAAGAAILVAFIWRPDGYNTLVVEPVYRDTAFVTQLIRGFLSAFEVRYIYGLLPFIYEMPGHRLALALPGIAVLILTAFYVRRSRWLLFFLAWVGWLYYIFSFKYPGFYWHGALLFLFTLWTLWLHHAAGDAPPERNNRALAAVLCALLILSTGVAAFQHRQDYRASYSGGKAMADFIRREGYEQRLIASAGCHRTGAVSGYLPGTPFWIIGANRYSRFIFWDASMQECSKSLNQLTVEQLREIQRMAKSQEVLILSGKPLRLPVTRELQMIHVTRGAMSSYFLYRLR